MTAAERLDVFFGETSDVCSYLYVRWTGTRDASLSGYVKGPFCDYSNTLPVRLELFQAGSVGDAVVLQTILPDPCFWTPDLPFVYQFTVDVAGESVVRELGIRPFGPAGVNLLYAGQRYVMRVVNRAVLAAHAADSESVIRACRDTGAALFVATLDETVAEFASRQGVLLIVGVDQNDSAAVASQLRQLAKWPAVAIAVLKTAEPLSADIGDAAPNITLARRITMFDVAIPDWAQVVFCEADELALGIADDVSKPVMAIKRIAGVESVVAARRLCDELQGEMAPIGDLAGYIVSCDNR